MIIEMLRNTQEELIIRINTYSTDKIIWTSRNGYGDWIQIKYERKKSRIHKARSFK